MLTAGSLLAASFTTTVYANDYEEHWAKEAIEKWAEKDIIEGYEDGTFKPKQAITRAELAKIISETAKGIIDEEINDSMTIYEKEKAIHDYFVANTKYSMNIT